MNLGFPLWIIAAHWINVLFIGFLIRAGIQIFGAYPRLYWNEHSTPGTEWLKFPKEPIPTDRPWTALEQERDVSPWLGQPGGNNSASGATGTSSRRSSGSSTASCTSSCCSPRASGSVSSPRRGLCFRTHGGRS